MKFDGLLRTTLILGNGFDIDLGLQTKFIDFINSKYFEDQTDNKLINYLKTFKDLDWVDIELKLAKYGEPGSSWTNLKAEYLDLKQRLCDYLSDQKRMKQNYSESISYHLIENVVKSSLDLNIVNYNYTDIAHWLIQLLEKDGLNVSKCKIHHIHGSLKNDNIIFGVHDKQGLINPKYSFLRKSSQDHYGKVKSNEFIDSSERVIVFGHSLGETDQNFFSKFFDTCTSKMVHIYHYDDIDNLTERLDVLTNSSLGDFKSNNNFEQINSKKISLKELKELYHQRPKYKAVDIFPSKNLNY